MTQPFVLEGESVEVRLSRSEVALLRELPALLATVGDDGGDPALERLTYDPHPDDLEAADAYREIVGGRLDGERGRDRSAFVDTLGVQASLDLDTADAWLRVLGEARLTLAARLGITEDWQPDRRSSDPMVVALNHLSYLQDELVLALMGGL